MIAFALVATAFASDKGALLYQEDFSGSTMPSGWAGKPGKWEMAGDAVKASEVAEDKHAAVRRHPLQYHDAIIEFWFELDGARMVAMSLNNKGGHVCRLMINPNGAILQVDQPKRTVTRRPCDSPTSTRKSSPASGTRPCLRFTVPK